MTDNDAAHLTGGYLLAEWEGAHKATGIGKRPWVRKAYPAMSYNAWWGRVYRAMKVQENPKAVEPKPELFVSAIEEVQTYEGDWMIVGDVHAPCTDYDFAQLVVAIAEKHLPACKGLIVAGDLFNADAFSKYDNIVKLPSWETELESTRHLIREWFEYFRRIIILMGNHERRILVHNQGQINVSMIKDMLTNSDSISMTVRDRCFIDTQNGKWLVTHGKNYSRNQLTNPSEYAIKYQCNVISHHEHHLAIGQDKYKRYTTVINGGLFDEDKLAYVQLETNNSPNMAKGFSMLRNGYAYLFGEDHFTDWDYWLSEGSDI